MLNTATETLCVNNDENLVPGNIVDTIVLSVVLAGSLATRHQSASQRH